MADELKIDLELKYPLYLRRFRGEERVVLVDSAHTPVAHFVNYHHAFEVVRLANCGYRLVSDLSQKPYDETVHAGEQSRNLEAGAQDPD